MTGGQYIVGAALLAVMLGSLAVTAFLVRWRLLPTWSHGPARVAEVVIGLLVLVFLSELLGAAGEFKRWPLIACSVVIATAAILVLGHKVHAREVASHALGDEPMARHPSAVATAGGILVAALAVIPWIHQTVNAVYNGMGEYDTLHYHMPIAVRFVQDASITRLTYTGNATFNPANSELIHAAGILPFQRDILSPLLNMGWLGLALLAGWCIGRPSGAGPATMAATALIAALPVMAGSQAGTAKNDIVSLALLLAAVALLVNAQNSRPVLILAALAAGLAAGTRLNLLAPVIALAAVMILGAGSGRRFGAAAWSIGLLVGSGFWYVRNLVEVGNPLPWFGVKIAGLLTLPSTTLSEGCGRTSIADYATDLGFVRAHLLPQLPGTIGAHWWIVLALAALGVCTALISRGTPMGRRLALVALASFAAYLLTPATASGVHAECFGYNTRYAAPALALGVILLALVLSRLSGPLLALSAILVALVLNARIPLSGAAPFISAVGSASVGTFWLGRHLHDRPWPASRRSIVAGAVAAAVAIMAVLGWYEQRVYLVGEWYVQPRWAEPIDGPYAVLMHVHRARIAVAGFSLVYPFFGRDLSNRVEMPAARVARARFATYSTCRSWVLALQRGRYDYVLTAQQSQREPRAADWTRRYPGARELLDAPRGTKRLGDAWRWELFRITLDGTVDPQAACAGPALSQGARKSPLEAGRPPSGQS
jgi:hypothetical protein